MNIARMDDTIVESRGHPYTSRFTGVTSIGLSVKSLERKLLIARSQNGGVFFAYIMLKCY